MQASRISPVPCAATRMNTKSREDSEAKTLETWEAYCDIRVSGVSKKPGHWPGLARPGIEHGRVHLAPLPSLIPSINSICIVMLIFLNNFFLQKSLQNIERSCLESRKEKTHVFSPTPFPKPSLFSLTLSWKSLRNMCVMGSFVLLLTIYNVVKWCQNPHFG